MLNNDMPGPKPGKYISIHGYAHFNNLCLTKYEAMAKGRKAASYSRRNDLTVVRFGRVACYSLKALEFAFDNG